MALAVAALGARGESSIETAESAGVTFPGFFRSLDALRR
jgi:5-enolpyruvylshikimate-3-phosphate synthase